jgi:deazaflavin-dependent oxidoreductase (nitroreductase family)
VARFNRRVTNPLTRPIAARLPGFGVVVHRGRTTGRRYRTPVNVFRKADGYVVALTYGGGDWVENVLSAGGCELVTRGQLVHVRHARLLHDAEHRVAPRVVRPFLRVLKVHDFLELTA